MTPQRPDDAPHSPGATDDAGEADEPGDDQTDRIADAAPRHTPLWAALSAFLLGAEAWLRSHGGRKLRLTLWGMWGLVGVAGSILLFGPVINPPATLEDITGSASSATETWIARDFEVDYALSRTADGRLVARVTERISALFPDDVDERGIDRVLATAYQGHALRPENIQATLDGAPLDVATSSTPERITISLDSSERLRGDHVFELSYTLHDLAYATTDSASETPVDLLEWDVFGPSWPQAFAGLDVRVTLPTELDEQLIRQPRGSLAWTIMGTGAWLDPEPGGSGSEVTYRFSNDQNIPPHAQAWFTLSFEPGTFTMPAPSPLHLLQVYGPIAPLVFLAATLLLALAARAVAWGDARGRPWFVAQSSSPDTVSPRLAAHILRTPRMMELAESLDAIRTGRRHSRGAKRGADGSVSRTQRELAITAAQTARRAGRLGDRPRALSRYFAASERRAQLTSGLRRVPRGFVRDLFIAAPLALTIVQWGLIRQLSAQTVLAVVWWPVAFVLVSSLISAIILWIALSSRPLTRRGALVKQHLFGIEVYAERTRLLERATPRDRLLPYAVLSAPRSAGRQIASLIEADLGEPGVSRRAITSDFLTWPRLAFRGLAVVLIAGAITIVATLPDPYPRSADYALYSNDLEGTFWTTMQAVDIAAELGRSADGHATLDVTERLTVEIADDASGIPQIARQWPASMDGQDLGLRVLSMTIDGDDAPFTASRVDNTVLLETKLVAPLSGSVAVDVHYVLDTAAVAASAGLGTVDRVRWAALLDGWQYDSTWDRDSGPAPFRVHFSISDELAASATSTGWISMDTTGDYEEWTPSVVPFDAADTDSTVHTLDLVKPEGESWPFDVTVDDVGARADFPAGTFVEPNPGALRWSQLMSVGPLLMVFGLMALAVAFPVWHVVWGRGRAPRGLTPGPLRDFVRWTAPAAALSACILFIWATLDMVADHLAFAPLGIATLAAIAGSVLGIVFTRAAVVTRRGIRGGAGHRTS